MRQEERGVKTEDGVLMLLIGKLRFDLTGDVSLLTHSV